MSLVDWLLGRRLSNREQPERRIGAFEAVPAMGLDGLGSSAYGPEAALTVLIPLGAAGLAWIGPVMAVIVALLTILYLSYRQTLQAYPGNGGAYIVSRENLGTGASLLAAAALMTDYVLNVAVGISAGVGALVSAVPTLHPFILPLCLGILALVTVVNLRGTLDAGRLFALPTYTFVVSLLAVLALGVVRTLVDGGRPQPVIAPPPPVAATQALSLWLLLRAFSSGCTAMTGVEAVSNGMSAFKEPMVTYGWRTLTIICAVLGLLLAGVAWLVRAYGVTAMDQRKDGYQSVLSQLTHAVVGGGPIYYVTIGSVLCVLALSACTSFVGFPRLCRTVAEDGFLPRPFAVAGRRLVFSVGILYLAAAAGLLLLLFGGITDRLIPLFAIGAFLTFTLSQAGMVVHWRRRLDGAATGRERAGVRARLVINAVGSAATGTALMIMMIAKFRDGAWITLAAVPLVILLLRTIRGYYDHLDRLIRDDGPLRLDAKPPVVVVVTEGWNRLTDEALGFALRLSPEVKAVHLTALGGPGEDDARAIRELWTRDVEVPARAAGLKPPELLSLEADYRLMAEPLLRLTRDLEAQHPDRTIAVILPELVKTNWWQILLHAHRGRRLRRKLLRYGGSRLVLIDIPWYLKEPRIDDALKTRTAAGETGGRQG